VSGYHEFLNSKSRLTSNDGFKPTFMPDFLFDFQVALLDWSIRGGRAATFADCGLGKTPMQLVWAENVVRKTNGRVLILTPLAVSHQTVLEGEKFGIECRRSDDGKPNGDITVTNYERLHYFDTNDYVGIVCDESSILKNFNGARKKMVTEFARKLRYRSAWTATAAPNDYIELGTTSEALGYLGFTDMLNRFFKNEQHTSAMNRYHGKAMSWRFKKHARIAFWKWVCSWARAVRSPSDLGFDDGAFVLPELTENKTIIKNTKPLPGELFVRPAIGLHEQRQELRATLDERCETVAEIVGNNGTSLVWCNLNKEGDLLKRLIPNSVQVSGADSDEQKEEKLTAFTNGGIQTLITKPKIAGFGLNWQHCSHMTFFPTHSYEQYYQGVRRCWRFGQQNPVTVDIVTTGGGVYVLENLLRKATAATEMFDELVRYMNEALSIDIKQEYERETEVPQWL